MDAPALSPARSRRIGWQWLGVGLFLALAFTLTPALRFMGWLLGSLFHETGHVAFAWYVGCPAFPAISLAGHAAAFHKPQSDFLLIAVGTALVAFTVWAWRSGRLKATATTLLVLWPLFAFVDEVREVGFLLSGHLGELFFAALFLVRARTGLDTQTEAERPLYACLGWFLIARNVALTAGLVFSASARSAYLGNGSFGLLNDYARIAFDVLHVPLASVALAMLLVALSVVPLVLWLTRRADDVTKVPRRPVAWSPAAAGGGGGIGGAGPYPTTPAVSGTTSFGLPPTPGAAPLDEPDLAEPPPSPSPVKRRTIPISKGLAENKSWERHSHSRRMG